VVDVIGRARPKVEDFDLPVPQHEHVLWLHVAMDDPLLVGGRQAARDLHRDMARLSDGECTGGERRSQRLALEQFRDGEELPVVDARVEDGKDVGMGKRRDGLRLSLKPGAAVRVAGERGRQHLDGDVSIEACVPRAVDFAHASGADRRDHFIRPEAGAGSEDQGS
jgi:hypothetical protein